MSAVVEATNLSRFYGVVLGLNNVSFAIRPGITGIVGPNGAGKTTLFRLLTGQIKPSSGELKVFGSSPWSDLNVRAQIAYCPEDEAVPKGVRAPDWLTGLGMISGLSAKEAKAKAVSSLERVNLPAVHWRKPVTALSKGMKQRVKLAQCLMHDPRLIILDEPMNGLDPMGRAEFSAVLRELAADGASVLISSHILQDLEALCREFILLRWGRMPTAGNVAANAAKSELAVEAIEGEHTTSQKVAVRWPSETTICCEAPRKLAGFLMGRGLLRGCDIDEEKSELIARWNDPAAFYEQFHQHLLASGVAIYEVNAPGSHLESAIEPPPLP
jgi:ABC-2 type transport system ATP-binding protein